MWPRDQKIALLLAIDAGRDVAQRVRIGIDETVAGRDIARRPHAHQSQTRAAGMRLIHALIQFRDRVADVGEAVHLAAQRIFQPLVGENVKLFQHAVHAFLVDGVQAVGRGGHGRKADLVKAEILFQMAEDSHHIGDAGGQRYARRDRPRPVIRDQRPHPRPMMS